MFARIFSYSTTSRLSRYGERGVSSWPYEADRIQEMFDTEEEICPQRNRPYGIGEKVLKSVTDFSYVPDKPILKMLAFQLLRQMIAVVGPTGSGKTTIMNLINRF